MLWSDQESAPSRHIGSILRLHDHWSQRCPLNIITVAFAAAAISPLPASASAPAAKQDVASAGTVTELPGELASEGMRSHSATASDFSLDDQTLQIDAAAKTAGGFVKSLPSTPGRSYSLDRNVIVKGASSSSKVQLVTTAYANSRPSDATVPGAGMKSATLTGLTADTDLFLHLRAPERSAALRVRAPWKIRNGRMSSPTIPIPASSTP